MTKEPELDSTTRRAVELLAAADEIATHRKPPRRWSDPVVICLILLTVAVMGMSVAIPILTHTIAANSSARRHDIKNLGKEIDHLRKRNDKLTRIILATGVKPGQLKKILQSTNDGGGAGASPSGPSGTQSNSPRQHPTSTVTVHPKVSHTARPKPSSSAHPSKSPSPHPSKSKDPVCRVTGICVSIPPIGLFLVGFL